MQHSNKFVFVLFLLAIIVMQALDYFFNWWLLPDLLVLMLLQLVFIVPSPSIWRFLLPLSLLMDISAQMFLGFYGLLYGLSVLMLLPLTKFWLQGSALEQLLLVVVFSLVFVVSKYLLAYLLTASPAPSGWYWPVLTQVMCWPLLRGIVAMVNDRFNPVIRK